MSAAGQHTCNSHGSLRLCVIYICAHDPPSNAATNDIYTQKYHTQRQNIKFDVSIEANQRKKNKKVIFKHRFQHNLPTPHASKSKYLVQNAYVLSVTKSEHHQRPTDG